MCGIFGIVAKRTVFSSLRELYTISDNLFILSESRGKEASGIAVKVNNNIKVYKSSDKASQLLRSKIYSDILKEVYHSNDETLVIMGHTRLVTNGSEKNNFNNQPIIKDGIVGIHNGIIVNENILWESLQNVPKCTQLDTEVLLSLTRKNMKENLNFKEATRKTFSEIYGIANIAFLFDDYNNLLLATNNGALYYMYDDSRNVFVFASENRILNKLLSYSRLLKRMQIKDVQHLLPNYSCLINTNKVSTDVVSTLEASDDFNCISKRKNKLSLEYTNVFAAEQSKPSTNSNISQNIYSKLDEVFCKNKIKIEGLIKCNKCLLPETFPFIHFDNNGVCNYCNSYIPKFDFKNKQKEKLSEFQSLIQKYPAANKFGNNVIIPFSGGRDSSYGLHFAKNELGLKPITFTYDWGMVTELARRNISRICSKLGVENIVISANLTDKRNHIRQNVNAWLKKPDIGIIPLFMAGDKYFFYHLNKVRKETGIDFSIWLSNRLENTDFKTGFCGVKPDFDKKWLNHLSLLNKAKFAGYYFTRYLLNPRYFNSSLFDVIGSYYSYFIQPRKDFYLLYDYLLWDEKTIEKTLIDNYEWEREPGYNSTWRIGDGTAAFYNYIYYYIAGFTENDSFRSNQIREGMITREEALAKVEEENKPRWDSIKWYCDIIGIDFYSTIQRINSFKTLYQNKTE